MLCRVAQRTQIVEQRINSEVKPMKNALSISLSNGNQGITRGKLRKILMTSFYEKQLDCYIKGY